MHAELVISPHGRLLLREAVQQDSTSEFEVPKPLAAAFAESAASGLLHLATRDLQSTLSPPLDFARQFARSYLTRLCQSSADDAAGAPAAVPPPTLAELATLILQAPPLPGQEYLAPAVLAEWWEALDRHVRNEMKGHAAGPQAWLSAQHPAWRFVGRVTFHLAENKRDPQRPFAFLATYTSRLSAQGRAQHEPLGRALQQYAGAKNRAALLALLVPIQRAVENSELARELVESEDVYHPLAWTPREAYRFLQDIPVFEQSGLIVRVPDWWRASRPPRPVVSVKVGGRPGTRLDAASLLNFSISVTLDGEPLTPDELQILRESVGGLVMLKGKWVEVDPDRLAEALTHWKHVERAARRDGLSFHEGMRLLADAPLDRDTAAGLSPEAREWVGLTAGEELARTLSGLRSPETLASASLPELRAQLRPYQQTGVNWLRFVTGLGLGACLADDMGLGKTVQVIALLLHLHQEHAADRNTESSPAPSLLIVPASLIANWKAELERFAPSLSVYFAHPSELPPGNKSPSPSDADGRDLVITTYTMLTRLDWLRKRQWHFAILDEAQAVKNPGSRQTRAVKELRAAARIALTGTPVENRLSDLWSIFDFLNPGLLGSAQAFGKFVKRLQARSHASYQPLRALVGPYILRRLKTDKRVIADLPEKTEVSAYCPLSRTQAALYEQAVRDLAQRLEHAEGIQRRGLVLAQLMRLKQICNHPSQVLGNDDYQPDESGKFQRLAALCGELAERQEKALVFTQFRELTAPLAQFLAGVFGRPGLVLHGGTAIGKRRKLVEDFQRDAGPPFFVVSLKAGGTGLNLTEASHVIHFDRWWNPAVENQATDRAFRIGQKRNVLVHKFVCRGTVEEQIDALIAEKTGLAEELLAGGGETLLTEMDNDQLLSFVALDLRKALDA
jgi:non-specific serine/threonine protein kinase